MLFELQVALQLVFHLQQLLNQENSYIQLSAGYRSFLFYFFRF